MPEKLLDGALEWLLEETVAWLLLEVLVNGTLE